MSDESPAPEGEEDRTWDELGDHDSVTVFAEFETQDVETFVDDLKAIAERTDMDGFRMEIVARVEAWGPKRCAVEFIADVERNLRVVKHHE